MDDFTPLCERCGYPIENLPLDGPCPECGRIVAESLPVHRRGTPWQIRPSLRSWLATNYQVLRHPRTQFEALIIQDREHGRPRSDNSNPDGPARGRGKTLAFINVAIASVLIVDPFVGSLVGDPLRMVRGLGQGTWTQLGAALLSIGAWVAGGMLVLFFLMWLETLGVRLIAKRRGWRLTKAAAWNVCYHASIGWVFSGLLPVLVLATLFALLYNFGIAPQGFVHIPTTPVTTVNVQSLISVGGAIVGYFAGMMIFESLVYVGIQSCRFAANGSPRPAASSEGMSARAATSRE